MARSGRASAALATAAIGSFVAGEIGTVALTFAAPILANMALTFGPPEYFALIVLGFTTISSVLGDTPARGLVSLFFGLAFGLAGIDLQTGQPRYTLGMPQLLDGIHVVVVTVASSPSVRPRWPSNSFGELSRSRRAIRRTFSHAPSPPHFFAWRCSPCSRFLSFDRTKRGKRAAIGEGVGGEDCGVSRAGRRARGSRGRRGKTPLDRGLQGAD